MSDEAATFRRLMDDWIVRARMHEEDRFAALLAKCESPIERRLAPYLVFLGTPYLVERLNTALEWQEHHELYAQYQIGDYRVDFALIVQEARWPGAPLKFVIECDGADWHDRTTEQRERDSRRDDYLEARGWHVIGFWGSEIHHDPAGCGDRASATINAEFVKRAEARTALALSGFRHSSEFPLTDEDGGNV